MFQCALAKNGSLAFAFESAFYVATKPNLPFVRWLKLTVRNAQYEKNNNRVGVPFMAAV